ncbi:MAG: DUF3313 domain-containing protein [Verrucomicrobiota bacterium]
MSPRRLALLLVPVLMLGMVSCKTVTPNRTDYLSSYSKMDKQGPLSGAQVYQGDVEDLKDYDKLYIEDVRYLGSTNGSNKQDVTSAEARELTQAFRSSLQNELGKSLDIVNHRGKSTLSLRVAITDARASKPGVFLATYAPYVSTASAVIGVASGKSVGAGAATMQAELLDSVTRERYYSIVDEKQGGKLQPQGIKRMGHAKASVKKWSRRFGKLVRPRKSR